MFDRLKTTVKNGLETLAEAAENPKEFVVPAPEEERKRREAICGDCSVRNGNFCDTQREHPLTGITGCGCYLPVKIALLNQHCDSDMW